MTEIDAPALWQLAGQAWQAIAPYYNERVEQDSDRYFFVPWASVQGAEREDLADLLNRLNVGLGGNSL